MSNPTKGTVFTHASYRDLNDPTSLALMKVTCVRKGQVYFTYAHSTSTKGAFTLPLETFNERYES
jgi:hypothetical protein